MTIRTYADLFTPSPTHSRGAYAALPADRRARVADAVAAFVDYAELCGFRFYRHEPPTASAPAPVAPEPAEMDTDFLPLTNTQKRTRRPRQRPPATNEAPLYDRTLRDRIVALITERGALTTTQIGQHFGMKIKRTASLIATMQNRGQLFTVGYTLNERNQSVKLLHTDRNHATSVPPVAPAAIVEEKRLAHKPPSLAAVDRGRALIVRNFSSDSIALQVFEQLCLCPCSAPDLQRHFRRSNSSIHFMVERMLALGIVERIGEQRNEKTGCLRTLFGVVEADELPPLHAPRVPPSPETVAAGRARILRSCIKGGGRALQVFEELCAHGPLTRGDLHRRLGGHRTMVDNALRTLDACGLVVDLGKVMDADTGHMCRLWDVRG